MKNEPSVQCPPGTPAKNGAPPSPDFASRYAADDTAWATPLVPREPEIHRYSDAEIASAAVNAINWITTVPIETIEVTAHNGRLVLEGTVETTLQRETVEEAVCHLAGVTGITELMAVEPAQSPEYVGARVTSSGKTSTSAGKSRDEGAADWGINE